MNTEAPQDVILECVEVTKSFPGVRALDGVSLRVRRGRMVALLGENGAGKSTLMNVLSGVFPPDAGTIRFEGRPVNFRSPHAAQQHGIGIVHQELNLVPDLSVAENIWLGREPITGSGLIDYERLHADTSALLVQLDLNISPAALVRDLRVGQQQLVEIAKALSARARVLILDEPTSSLSAHEVRILFRVVQELKKQQVALVYITHKFEELAGLCDDVVILRDGRVVGEADYRAISRERIVQLMAGRTASTAFDRKINSPGAEILRAEKIVLPGEAGGRAFLVDQVSFVLRRGEVLGIFGLVGAGRTELCECLVGLHASRSEGRLFLEGRPVTFRSPADAVKAGVVLAPEDRKLDGLILPMSVGANASLACLEQTVRSGGWLDTAREEGLVAPLLQRFRVKTSSREEPVGNLSGGNQQKVILAKWMATAPNVLLLDEPTRGIDVNAKREIYAFIDDLAAAGLGVIVISSELPEVLTLSDRVLVMCEGRLKGEFDRAHATPETVLQAALK